MQERRRAPRRRSTALAALRAERDQAAARLRLQFDRMPIACIVTDAENRIVEWNGAAEEVFGWPAAQALGKDGVALLVSKRDQPNIANVLGRLATGDLSAHSVNENVTKDGRVIHCEWHNTPLRGPDGQVIGMMSMARDITQRRQAEQALRESEASLAAELASMARLQEVSTRLVQTGGPCSLLQEIVDAAIAITGADTGNIQLLDPRDDMLHIVASSGFNPEFLEAFDRVRPGEAPCGRAAATAQRVVVEDIAKSSLFPNARAQAVALAAGVRSAQCTPLVARSGKLVGVLSTCYRTPRRPAARDLRVLDMLARQAADWIERTQAEEALRGSEERFRRTFDCNMVPMGIWNRDGAIVEANNALLQMLGYTRAEVAAGDVSWIRITPPEHRPLDQRALADIDKRGVSTPYEKDYIHKDGRRIPVLIGSAAFTGTADSGVFFALDLTERKRAEQDRKALLASEREARSAAENANRLKDEFLALVSHELKTPIVTVLTWAHLIKTHLHNPDMLKDAAAAVESGVKMQIRLIDDLLDVSRVTSGKLRIERAPMNLVAAVEAAIGNVLPDAQANGIVIRRTFSHRRASTRGDGARLQQVFWNLLANAVKFTPRGGYIDVRLERAGARWVVSIRDTGEGIEPQLLPRLFDRFRQADSSAARRHSGLGLGLSIVKHLVEAHDGTIQAESQGRGRGATFTVSLPSRGAAQLRSARRSVARSLPAGLRVLFVDDNPDTRTAVARILDEHKAEIVTASDADEALELLAHARPDVLVADVGMPGKDGYQLIRDVRRTTAHRKLPAIALTAFARPEDRDRALEAGYDLHLAKPVDPGELLTALRSVVRVRAGRAKRT
jgi:PAS domain S-box-containing protein